MVLGSGLADKRWCRRWGWGCWMAKRGGAGAVGWLKWCWVLGLASWLAEQAGAGWLREGGLGLAG